MTGQLATVNETILMSVFGLSILDVIMGFLASGNYKLIRDKNIQRKMNKRKRIITERIERTKTDYQINSTKKTTN